MALPSQTGRASSSGRTYVYRGGKGRRSKLGPAVFAVLLVVVGAWFGWRVWSDRAPGEGTLAGAEAGSAGAADGAAAQADTAPPAVVIDQGGSPTTLLDGTGAESASGAPAALSGGTRPSETAQNSGAQPAEPQTPTRTNPRMPSTQLPEPGALSDAIRKAEEDQSGGRTQPPAPAESFTERRREPSAGTPAPGVAGALAEAERLIARNDPIAARSVLNGALLRVAPNEAGPLRDRLTRLNDDLVFSPKVYPGVVGTEAYTIAAGDTLSRITYRNDLAVDWRLIQRVNRIANPQRIRVGQSIKLVRGPFHAVVSKSGFRLDLYQGPPEEPDRWTYIRSFDVGLGEDSGTPTGVFRVRPDSKLVNPRWTNPRTGEHFEADDPENPIGEHWIGLQGLGESAVWEGYGIHGTTDPDSIGQERSMGCVRLGHEDVAFVYELLVDGVSVVVIED